MITTNLQQVADLVVRQARRKGCLLPRQVRAVLTGAGVDEALYKDVLTAARSALTFRGGRYYYTAPVSARVRDEQSRQRSVQQTIRQIIRQYRRATDAERRQQDRFAFVQPVQVHTEDGRRFTLLSRDLSATGIRLIGTQRFLGQKVRVAIPAADGSTTWEFVVRILWTCAVGDDLVENGGAFLERASHAEA